MKQTRLQSFAESIANIAIGMGVALGSQYAIFPFFGINISGTDHLWITFWFTFISLARSYMIRRWFNSYLTNLFNGKKQS